LRKTINPWISFNLTKDIDTSKPIKIVKKESKLKIRKKYLNFMEKFL
jgi:hypothetical protein